MGFRGRIVYLSQLIADSITGAQIIGGTITGALFRTAATGKRWEISSSPANVIKSFSGIAGEVVNGQLAVDNNLPSSTQNFVYLAPPSFYAVDGAADPSLYLLQDYGNNYGNIQAYADKHDWLVLTTADAANGGPVSGHYSQKLHLDSTGLWLTSGAGAAQKVLTGNDSGWITVSSSVGFLNGWIDFDTAPANRPAQYRKIGNEVRLRGFIRSGTMGQPAFLLPSAYRPTNRNNQGDYWLSTASNGAFGAIVLDSSNGGVVPQVGSNAWFSLDGLSWWTD